MSPTASLPPGCSFKGPELGATPFGRKSGFLSSRLPDGIGCCSSALFWLALSPGAVVALLFPSLPRASHDRRTVFGEAHLDRLLPNDGMRKLGEHFIGKVSVR